MAMQACLLAPRPTADEQVDDMVLVERAKAGDNTAFDALVRRHHGSVCRVVNLHVRNKADVLDVVQDAFVKAYRALAKFRGDSAFSTWIYRVAVNCAMTYHDRRARRLPSYSALDVAAEFQPDQTSDDGPTPEHALINMEIVEATLAALAALPDQLRRTIVLRELHGYSYEDIATDMSCPVGTVRSRLFRARQSVSETLEPLLG